MSTLTTPYEYAQEVLAVCHNAVSDTAAGEIDRRYVCPGRPAFDCEQLTVSGWTLGEADTVVGSAVGAGKRHTSGRINLIGFLITVIRDCVPVTNVAGNDIPEPERIEAAAVEVLEDVWAIWTYLYSAMRAGDLFEGKCDLLFMDGATPVETEGTFAGYEILIRAHIPGLINAS